MLYSNLFIISNNILELGEYIKKREKYFRKSNFNVKIKNYD